jgi:hypothetical protein
VQNVPLEVEHIHPKAKGGTNRVSNLCIACNPCNTKKGCSDIAVFLKDKPDLLRKIETQAKHPLKDATAVNATRWALFEKLKAIGLLVEVGSGGRYSNLIVQCWASTKSTGSMPLVSGSLVPIS